MWFILIHSCALSQKHISTALIRSSARHGVSACTHIRPPHSALPRPLPPPRARRLSRHAPRPIAGSAASYPRHFAHSIAVCPHYYTNDFARRCFFINGGGHKIQPPRLMPAINRGRHFLFTETDTFSHLLKSIYDGGRFKALPPKILYFRRRSS